MPTTTTTLRLTARDRENLRLVCAAKGLRSLTAAIGFLAEEAAARYRAGGVAPAATPPKKSRAPGK